MDQALRWNRVSILGGRSDGRWNLDAVQPDPSPAAAKWYAEHPNKRPTPLAFETAGRPGKMIKLRALNILGRVG